MGKINRGILGGFQGKVGTVVGTRWRGINVMRAMPERVRNPNTIPQRRQREKFKLVTELLQKARPVFRSGFAQTGNPNLSPFNAAMSWNIRYAIKGEYPGQELDFPQVRFAMGSLENISQPEVNTAGPGEIAFTWTDNTGTANAEADDRIMVILYNENKGEAVYSLDAATREAGSAAISIPESLSGETFHAWIATLGSQSSISSDSQYLGTITPT